MRRYRLAPGIRLPAALSPGAGAAVGNVGTQGNGGTGRHGPSGAVGLLMAAQSSGRGPWKDGLY